MTQPAPPSLVTCGSEIATATLHFSPELIPIAKLLIDLSYIFVSMCHRFRKWVFASLFYWVSLRSLRIFCSPQLNTMQGEVETLIFLSGPHMF